MRPQARLRAWWTALAAGMSAAAAVSLGLLVFMCVFLAVAAPRASAGARTAALRNAVSQLSPLRASVLATSEYTSFDANFLGARLRASAITSARTTVAAGLTADRIPLARTGAWSGLQSGFSPVSGAARSASNGGTTPQMELLYRDTLAPHIHTLAGRLPSGGHASSSGTVFQVAVTRATAARFGLAAGSRLGLGPGVTLLVTGIIEPRAPGSAFWLADPVAATPSLIQHSANFPGYWTGAAFVSAAEIPLMQSRLDVSAMSLSWDFPLSLHTITADQAQGLYDSLERAGATAGPVTGGTLSSGVSSILAGFVDQDRAVTRVLGLLFVSLTAVGAAVIGIGALQIAEGRESEFGLFRARGASRRQVALLTLRGSAIITLPAAAAAAALAVALTAGDAGPLPWALGGVTVLVALVGPALSAGLRRRDTRPAGGARHDAAPTRAARARRLVIETALSAAAVGGLIVLRQQGGMDLFTSMAPVLVAIPAAVLVTRCYPLAVRALLRAAAVRPGVSAFVGLARAVRAPRGAVIPVFAMVLALAVVAFGSMAESGIHRAEVAASWQRTGGDALIDATGSATPLTAAVRRAVAAVPGVTGEVPVVLTSGSSAGGTALTVAAVNPSRYAALIAHTSLPPFPAAKLARPDSAAPGAGAPVPVLASPQATAALGRAGTRLSIGPVTMRIKVVGRPADVPGVPGASVVVVPLWSLGSSAPPPSLLLVAGTRLDSRRLDAVIHRDLPGATVTLRSRVLSALGRAPLSHSASVAFTGAAEAAVGFALLVVLISLLTGARSRELTVTRLKALGMSRAQATGLVMVEVLPQLAAAAAGGAGCAWLLGPLTGASIGLSAFTPHGAGVALAVQPWPLAAAAGGLILLALLIVAAEDTISSRRPGTRGLEAGEF